MTPLDVSKRKALCLKHFNFVFEEILRSSDEFVQALKELNNINSYRLEPRRFLVCRKRLLGPGKSSKVDRNISKTSTVY